jgi:hypothetical protein
MILKLLEGQNDRRYIKQAIQVLNTLVDSPNTDYAIRFIRSGGIKVNRQQKKIDQEIFLDYTFKT